MTMIRSVATAALLLAVSGSSLWAAQIAPPTSDRLAFSLEEMNCISSDSQNQIPCAEKSRA